MGSDNFPCAPMWVPLLAKPHIADSILKLPPGFQNVCVNRKPPRRAISMATDEKQKRGKHACTSNVATKIAQASQSCVPESNGLQAKINVHQIAGAFVVPACVCTYGAAAAAVVGREKDYLSLLLCM